MLCVPGLSKFDTLLCRGAHQNLGGTTSPGGSVRWQLHCRAHDLWRPRPCKGGATCTCNCEPALALTSCYNLAQLSVLHMWLIDPTGELFLSRCPSPDSLDSLQQTQKPFSWAAEQPNERAGLCQVDKAACNYYTLQVSREQVAAGFVVGVHSKVGSRFKLLLFERAAGAAAAALGPDQWELVLQVSTPSLIGYTAALLYPALDHLMFDRCRCC